MKSFEECIQKAKKFHREGVWPYRFDFDKCQIIYDDGHIREYENEEYLEYELRQLIYIHYAANAEKDFNKKYGYKYPLDKYGFDSKLWMERYYKLDNIPKKYEEIQHLWWK